MKSLFDKAYGNKDLPLEDRKKLDTFAQKMAPIVRGGMEENPEKLKQFKDVVEEGINVLEGIHTPQSFKPLREFVIDQSSKTFSNMAINVSKIHSIDL